MAAINHFTILGNLTKNVELRYTPNGTPAATYAVAINDVWYDHSGTKHEETDFIPVTTYGAQAESDAKFLKRGAPVCVVGRIRSWYKRTERKGGFNFEAITVKYIGKPGGERSEEGDAPSADAGHAEWLSDYDKAQQAGGR